MSTFDAGEYAGLIPAEEEESLLVLHRATFRWREALRHASRVRAVVGPSPVPRLTRCLSQRERDVEAMAGLVVGAARAWDDREVGPLFVRDMAGWSGWIRIDWGHQERVLGVEPGEAEAPTEVDLVVDLPVLERALVEAAVRARLAEDVPLLDSVLNCVALRFEPGRNSGIGPGQITLTETCSLWTDHMREMREELDSRSWSQFAAQNTRKGDSGR